MVSHPTPPRGAAEHHTDLPAELDSSSGQRSAIVQVQPYSQQVPWCSFLLACCQLVCEAEEGYWHQGPLTPAQTPASDTCTWRS